MNTIKHVLSSVWFIPLAVVALIATCAYVPQAQGQEVPTCITLDDVKIIEKTKYGRTLSATMLSLSGELLVVFSNPDTGAWSLGMRLPSGCMFPLGTGTDWTVISNGRVA